MGTDEGISNGFQLSSTQGKRPNSNTVFYRLHALKSENEVFTVRPCMTEDYIDERKVADPFPVLKEDAMRELKRRINEKDFEPSATYECTFTLTGKTPYRKVEEQQ
ncbi:MAG: hypothetical protein AAB489_04015 [Patescibacteria group bacterium]